MTADVRHGAEDQEPEFRVGGKAPAKKPLAEFLAEFDERLANHPDEPATGALRVVEERAAGLRLSPAETAPTRYASTEIEAAETPAPAAAALDLAAKALADEAGVPDGVTGKADPDTTPAETSGESRRLRGRRRRKHRHKAH